MWSRKIAQFARPRNRSSLTSRPANGRLTEAGMTCPHCRDVAEEDAAPATCGVAPATRTVSPEASVSDGLLIIRSDGDRPASTSTLSPRSRPSCTLLRTTLLLLSRVATWAPWLPVTSAVDGIFTRLGSVGIWKCTLQ